MSHPARRPVDSAPQMVAPQDMGPSHRKRLSGPGLRSFLAIADLWGLSEKDRLAVLGQPSRSAYYGWVRKAQDGAELTLGVDVLLRISAVLGIHKALAIFFTIPPRPCAGYAAPIAGCPSRGRRRWRWSPRAPRTGC